MTLVGDAPTARLTHGLNIPLLTRRISARAFGVDAGRWEGCPDTRVPYLLVGYGRFTNAPKLLMLDWPGRKGRSTMFGLTVRGRCVYLTGAMLTRRVTK